MIGYKTETAELDDKFYSELSKIYVKFIAKAFQIPESELQDYISKQKDVANSFYSIPKSGLQNYIEFLDEQAEAIDSIDR